MAVRKVGLWTASIELIVVGVVVLLQVFHVVSWSVWEYLWPIFIIFFGVELLWTHYRYRDARIRLSGWGVTFVILLILLTVSIEGAHRADAFVRRYVGNPGVFVHSSMFGNGGNSSGPAVSTNIQGSQFVPSGISTIEVKLPYGHVNVQGSATSQLSYHAQLTALASDVPSSSALHREWTVTRVGNVLKLVWNAPYSMTIPYQDDTYIDVTAPKRLVGDVKVLDGGQMDIRGLAGVNLHVTNGTVAIADIRGNVDAQTTNGTLKISQVSGKVKANTINGIMSLRSIDGSIHSSSVNGVIRVQSEVEGAWDIRTGNGQIDLSVPRSTNATITATTGLGAVSGDIPWSQKSHKYGSATLGNGSNQIQLNATLGSINVYYGS
jgi:hypothetical protein